MTKPVIKTIEMTRKQHKAWDKYLCSGTINQTQGELLDKNGAMCCLGVLEYALEGKVCDKDEGFPSHKFLKRNNIKFYDDEGSLITHSEPSPYLTGGYAHQLNDYTELSFKQIAQRIKSRVKYIPETKKKKS